MSNINFGTIAKSLGNALQSIGTYSANSAARANSISAASQSAQGAFNQASANNANTLNMASIANQYGFNSAQAQAANEYNTQAWERAASWNEEMFNRQMDFNREEAQKQRDWQTQMANTQYQRAMADMKSAGLNPILAYGGIGGGVPGGATASVGTSAMGATSANMATGGLLGASTASEGNYMGQMEQMGTTLALLGAIFSGISSATDAATEFGSAGKDVLDTVVDTITDEWHDFSKDNVRDKANKIREGIEYVSNPVKGLYNTGKYVYNHFMRDDGSRAYQFKLGHAKG